MFLARTALAAPGPGVLQRRKVLVSIFQRGAMDGLMAIPPLAEEKLLKKYRPLLAMGGARSEGENRILDLGNGFGLHPALAAFEPLWKERRLAIAHQVGSPDATRSHFDAQDYMETGTPGRKGTPSGWLNRVSGLLGHDGSPLSLRVHDLCPSALLLWAGTGARDLAARRLTRCDCRAQAGSRGWRGKVPRPSTRKPHRSCCATPAQRPLTP